MPTTRQNNKRSRDPHSPSKQKNKKPCTAKSKSAGSEEPAPDTENPDEPRRIRFFDRDRMQERLEHQKKGEYSKMMDLAFSDAMRKFLKRSTSFSISFPTSFPLLSPLLSFSHSPSLFIGALVRLLIQSSKFVDKTPRTGEMPADWLKNDLEEGLRTVHLYPDFHQDYQLEGRDELGHQHGHD
ncbi:hypothetical protein CPB84DRAFT_127964 [Gymnopilus junonius]|uniref:Uncharacterized protein n=1 Tax=Gymnopilus junonius TaxID=109634 RepID=A0A9P5TEU3_GYMJU|nr:hypothetical protein CPB84DRAFT_127964 [Gymnopilus junonius]